MQINSPQEIVERVERRVATETEVVRRALDSLDWQDQERQAIQEGIDAWRAGDVQDFDEFDAEFRAKNGIQGGTTPTNIGQDSSADLRMTFKHLLQVAVKDVVP